MTYTAAIIGAGIGTRHAWAYRHHDIDVVAIADIDGKALDRLADEHAIAESSRYRDVKTMLEECDVDVVSVCSPTYLHAEHAIAALSSPPCPDVLWLEKPIACSVADADRIIDEADQQECTVLVNHIGRFSTDMWHVRELIQQGEIGDIVGGTITSGGPLFRSGTHSVDKVQFLFDVPVSSVTGTLQSKDSHPRLQEIDDSFGVIVAQLSSGITIPISHTLETEALGRFTSSTIYGTDGVIETGARGGITYYEREGRSFIQTSAPSRSTTPIDSYGDGGFDSGSWDQCWYSAGGHVRSLLEGDENPLSAARTAREVLEVLIGGFVSSYTGSHVELPLKRPLREVSVIAP